MSQLKMQRPNLDGLGEVVLPSGYQIRSYREGDEAAWAKIVNNSLGGQWNAKSCHRDLTGCPQFRPGGLFFAIHKDNPVGTTCAWTGSINEKEVGQVHMVGVIPEHRGKRLGYALCLRAYPKT